MAILPANGDAAICESADQCGGGADQKFGAFGRAGGDCVYLREIFVTPFIFQFPAIKARRLMFAPPSAHVERG